MPVESLEEITTTPAQSPSRSSFGFTPDRQPGQPSTILLRRVSTSQRMIVDRGLIDVFSESCATARRKAQLQHALFFPGVPSPKVRDRMSIRESSMIRRRRSFLDARPSSMDIAITGEIRGSVISIRPSRSVTGKRCTPPSQRRRAGSIGSKGYESATEVEGTVDETVTSDFGTLTGQPEHSRASSPSSISRMASPRRSFSNLRRPDPEPLNRRKTASAYNLHSRRGAPDRAKSMPVSPIGTPFTEAPPPRLTKSHSYAPDNLLQPSGDASPVYALGNGFTNQSERSFSISRWSSLRPSMSFVKGQSQSQRNSTVSLMDLASEPSTTDFGEQTGSRSSDEGITSAATFSDRSGDDDESREISPSVPSTPKKKRNSIFQSLSRFTPI